MSVGAPTWRGLKLQHRNQIHFQSHVSRCPDMEGIETLSPAAKSDRSCMSVGAPTWRGLKHPQNVGVGYGGGGCQ